MQTIISEQESGSSLARPTPGWGLDAEERRQDSPETSVATPRRALPLIAIAAKLRRLIGVSLVYLALGSTLGYGIGMVTVPRPPPPGPAVARYMAGLQQMDGTELWASMSPHMQAQAIKEGDSPTKFAAFYEQLKARGSRIDQVQYVGGYQTRGKGIFTYVTRRIDPGKEPLEIIWILVTGPEGLIDFVF